MRLDSRWSRGVMIVLGVAALAASFASPAAADNGRRYKGHGGYHDNGGSRAVQHGYASPGWGYAYSSGRSCGAPAFAGFIGGLIVGTALAHAAPPPHAYCAPVAVNYYYDPYCHQRFSSLDAYGDHLDYYRHPAYVQVMDGNSGRCVGERYWQNGRWRDRGDFHDYGNHGQYGDPGDEDDQGDQGGNWNR